MKVLFGLLMIFFMASTVWARAKEEVSVKSCIEASVDKYAYIRSIKDEQVKVESDFLYCLNSVPGISYASLFDVPDDILQKRYEFIMSERAKQK